MTTQQAQLIHLTPEQGKEALALAAYEEARRCSLAFNPQGYAYWAAVGDAARADALQQRNAAIAQATGGQP